MEDLNTFTKWTWAMTAIAQALLLCLLVARRNANIYPAFTAYIFMTLAQSGLLYVAIQGSGFSSLTSYRIGWATQAVVMGARAFAVAELCRHVLGRFRGVWLLARWSSRDRHAAALRPLLRYYGSAPAPLAGRWPLAILVRLGSERCHPGALGQPLRFLLEPLGNGRISRLPALVDLGVSPPRSTNGRQSDVRGRHRIHEHRSGNEFAFALAQ